jgi:mono/diheme cytochrome c family protein
MKSLFLLLLVPAIAAAQSSADLLKQGEDVFARTCANSYCHGPQGAGGGAPRLAARDFDRAFINNTVTRGIPNTAMQSFSSSLSRPDLAAVVAYVAKLNGVSTPVAEANSPAPAPAPALSAGAVRGRDLFFDAVRGFARCATCHEVNGVGIPVAAPITAIPASAAALRALPTPRISTVTVSGEAMPALVLARRSQNVMFYDLSTPPPVLRTELPTGVDVREGSSWRHLSVTTSYKDDELSSILDYLRAVIQR